jgi:hypothetical protein
MSHLYAIDIRTPPEAELPAGTPRLSLRVG